MKRIIALLFLSLAFTQCTWLGLRRKPGTLNPVVTKERWEDRDRARSAFEDGKADGAADAARGTPKDYKAHTGHFDSQTEPGYREGYNQGFDQSSANGTGKTLTAAEQAARDAGYAAGLRDRRRGRGSDPDQYAGTYDAKLASWFLDGYQEGFEEK